MRKSVIMPMDRLLYLWLFASAVAASLGSVLPGQEPAARLNKIVPTSGSLAGGCRIEIHGEGFSPDQFDKNKANKIVFKTAKHQLNCNILLTDVSERKLSCEIEPSPIDSDETYEVVMIVRGKEVTDYCEGRTKCKFRFSKSDTPTIDGFHPQAGVPGTLVKISGLIFTIQVSRLSKGFSPENKEITRIYVGLECDPINDTANGELFDGAEIDDSGHGSIACLPKIRTPGSHLAAIMVSLRGRSSTNKVLLRVNKNQELYVYQTHSDIQGVSPSCGSVHGETVITLQGLGFTNKADNVKVSVGGVPCKVLSSTYTEIKCKTGPSDGVKNISSGSRGLLRECWTSTLKNTLSDIASLNSSAADHRAEYLPESRTPEGDACSKPSGYSCKISGFFVPLQNDTYRFGIKSEYASELYLSSTEDPADKAKIASCSSAARDWNSDKVQESGPMSLEQDKEYYLEAYYNVISNTCHQVNIRAGLDKTNHTNAKVGAARDEHQRITISSRIQCEKQILDFSNWDEDETACEVQRISIQSLQCVDNNITTCDNNTDNFTLSYLGESITLSLQDTDSSVLEEKLNELSAFKSLGRVNVTTVNATEGNSTVFLVWFCFTDPRGVELLHGTAANKQRLLLNITRLVKGQSAKEFQFMVGGVRSEALKPSSTQGEMEKVLKHLFSKQCEESSAGRFYYKNYEEDIPGRVSGQRVSDVEPLCGRYSLKNPSILWKAGYSSFTEDILYNPYKIYKYKWFCFAHKGPIRKVVFKMKYKGNNGDEYPRHVYDVDRSSKWSFLCINVWTKISEEFQEKASGVEMLSIEIWRHWDGSDVYVDNVWIGKNQLSVTPTRLPAKLHGFVVKDFTVEKTSETNWTICLQPANCGSPLPLLAVADTIRGIRGEGGNADLATFTKEGLNSSVHVKRVQKASPPIQGTFDIEYKEMMVKDLPANISAMRLKDLLEQELEEGIIEVKEYGHCAWHQWDLTWKTVGGNHPEMKVHGSALAGVQVSTVVKTIQDGGLFLDPIPGEFLRTPTKSSEVVVVTNDIIGSCQGRNCSFEYCTEQTPNLTSISPSSGPCGTIIQLNGSGFSTENEENYVTVGGFKCTIVSSAADKIECRADCGGGKHKVDVRVNNKGLAANDQELTFTCEIKITSVSANNGSTAGGQVISIDGCGFGSSKDNANVSLGGSRCEIRSIETSRITCRTTAHVAGNVSVEISIDDSSAILSDSYEYVSLGSQVTSVSPLRVSVSGGEVLNITGTGLMNTEKVHVGNEDCVIQTKTDVEITCFTPPQAPGIFPLSLLTRDLGFIEIPEEFRNIHYLFEVYSICPPIGSVAGGTDVVITGRGFGADKSRAVISVRGRLCKITSYSDTQVICETMDIFEIIEVDNSGSHPDFGRGYEWNPKSVRCHQGDIVKFGWAGISDAVYNVFQTSDSSSVNYDGSGFHSGNPIKTGIFTHRFLDPGRFFYAGSGTVTMKGVVNVRPFRTASGKVSFKIAGFEALYNVTSCPNSSSTCEAGRTDAVPGCNASLAAKDPNSNGFEFTYSECSTPRVSSVTPANGTSNTIITVHGRGFSNESCHNKVTFSSHACDVISSTETAITCRLSTADNPIACQPLDVKVKVRNRGYAFVRADVNSTTHFTLNPSITGVSPRTGSQAGGTRLTVTGHGFRDIDNKNVVRIGSTVCDVITSSFNTIVCTTRASVEQEQQATVTIDRCESECVAADSTDCEYTFARDKTPVVSKTTPVTICSPQQKELRFEVSGLPSSASDVTITMGDKNCRVTQMVSPIVKCELDGIAAGTHKVVIHVSGKGNAEFASASEIVSEKKLDELSPSKSSINGGLKLTIEGCGFDPTPGKTIVTIGGTTCKTVNVTYGKVECETPRKSVGSFDVDLVGNQLILLYSLAVTPSLGSISPETGKGGDVLTIDGSGLEPSGGEVQVHIGDVPCAVTSSQEGSVVCTLAAHTAGSYPIVVLVPGRGFATSNGLSFTYILRIDSVNPNESGFGGGRNLVIQGHGFDNSAQITICGNECTINSDHTTTTTEISCEAPSHTLGNNDQQCDIEVRLNGFTSPLANGYTYKLALTSKITSVTPSRGGTGGGTTLTIQGSGFSSIPSDNVVSIDGTNCTVTSANSSLIICQTGAHNRTVETSVRVDVGNNGKALDGGAKFHYIDVWSSRFTWGNQDPPAAGALVVIKKGQTILLDQDTPVLKLLLIQGGRLEFDAEKPSLHLQAENILITDNGCLQVGTENEPFPGQATITLHGHVRSREIPVYGAKTLALREGKLDLHGLPVPITWTHLNSTAEVGATLLHLVKQVTWKPGDKIILAPTGKSQREFEELEIKAVHNNGLTLEISPALEYKHISMSQTFDGTVVETRAEVGLLTRNVRVKGSVNSDWTEKIEACPKEFQPGQFQTQTCFQGKFGEEIGSDEFGVQIMIHAPEESKDLVTARFSYVEISHAGQAFRLGRYPIHFHLSGDVFGSYVRGCAIHHSFNRAITMHGIHRLHVSHNVVFNVRGNAFFMEDGIETGNVVEYNLGVFVIASSSALNVDITPATFWVTNANNTVRHNSAAGGSHFGFWYQMFEHPDGPSFTPDYCPRNVPMLTFVNNSAHSFGRYGLWIFPVYHPQRGGRCKSFIAEPAVFGSFLAYSNMRGAEAVKVGAVQMHDFKVLDNDIAGIEYVFADTADAPRGGPKIKNALIVGHSQVSEGLVLKIDSNTRCTTSGIKLPQFSKLLVDGATFVNFDQEGCTCYSFCAQCKEFKKRGGWTTFTKNIRFVNSPRRSAFQWNHESLILDLDGSSTGHVNGSIVPQNANLPPDKCVHSSQDSHGSHPGWICDSNVTFRRFAFNKAAPASLHAKNVLLTNQHGTDVVPYAIKGATHPHGWMMTLILGDNYYITFEDASQITNITYCGLFYDMKENDYVWINHNLTQTPDHFTTTGVYQEKTSDIPPPDSQHGNWSFWNETNVFTYIASGKDGTLTPNNNNVPRGVCLRVYRCYYEDCITPVPPPPPQGRPLDFLRWSEPNDWDGTEPMYGGYGQRLPANGSDVMILREWYMLADMQLPYLNKLLVYGTLEIEDRPGERMVLNASIIFISGGLIVGWPDKPYLSNFVLSLQGDVNSEELPMRDVNVGSKALAVFGYLWMHGKPIDVYWTQLAVTAEAGDHWLILVEPVDWNVGDEIVVASTTVETQQTEKFTIQAISPDRRNLTLDGPLQYKHIAETHTAGNWSYTMAAEVGLFTRNIVIEGADNPAGAWGQSFGGRVLIGRTAFDGIEYKGSARIANVEFRRCGQEGWIDDYDPRFCLAFLNTGDVEGNTSYVRGNSFHDAFNTGIGIFGTNNLTIEDNVVHHTVGPSIRVAGKFNSVVRNLAVYSISIHTYNGRVEKSNVHWPGAIEVHEASDVTLINNTVAGSERFGFTVDGEKCTDNSPGRSFGNQVHGAWHGIHLPYAGGLPVCSMLYGYLTWNNLDYGMFIYPQSSVIVVNSIVVDNTVGVFPNVWGPHALSHKTADKYVIVRNSLIVGTSPNYDCAVDNIVPYARRPFAGDVGAKKAPGGGKIGLTISQFGSSPANGPTMPFENPLDYPAINGYTLYHDVTFDGFQETCGKRHRAIMTNSWVGDILHPVDVRGLHFVNVDTISRLFYDESTTQWINPSDCVDMDCDARRQVLIRDLDGSLTGAFSTIISKAEDEWGGDARYGLGDYRIPKPALTAVDGARLDIADVAPNKGIVRSTADGTNRCSWEGDWNAYKCSSIDYRMLVIESLDHDTETRRLSPVALIANGYVNLLNGPQDHGWCLGYTCQERISTFYGIVATGTNYSLYFTSNEPQNMRLHLLNSDSTDVIRLGIFYQRPQRQDVYKNGVFINPTNGIIQGSEFTLAAKPPGAPDDYYEPPLTSIGGDNYFDRNRATLFVIVRGQDVVEIRVVPVVVIQLGMAAVSVDDFFGPNLVNNLAGLLGIDNSRIRIVNIVSESGRRRRRAAGGVSVVIEIGDPPLAVNGSSSSNYTGVNETTSFDQLKNISDAVVENIQTGKLAQQLNVQIVSLSVSDPIAPPVDPTGGVRATNETGGPNITDNSTLRYDQLQSQQAADAPSNAYSFLIPAKLEIDTEPNGANETVPFTLQPKLRLVDIDGTLVKTLGHGSLSNWTVMATIKNGTGDPKAVLEGNVTVTLVDGWANFTDLSITHNRSDYQLFFYVNKPVASHFNATSQPFEVKERILYFTVTDQPNDANETVSFGQQPIIEVRDAANGEVVDNTGWKGRQWIFRASLANPENNDGHLNGTTQVEFVQGVAQFTNLSVDISGDNYILALEAMTAPTSGYVFNGNSSAFNVSERELYLKLVQQPGDCNDTVICGYQPILEIRDVFLDTPVDNIGWRGRSWYINATMVGSSNSVVNGTTLLSVPTSGRAEFPDLNFYDVAQDHEIEFTVVTEPPSSYSGLSVRSEKFNVTARQFYLEVVTQPANANQSEIFGVSPVVEVRDLGTRMRGHPLKGDWSIATSLKSSVLNGTLSGVLNATVVNERVEFTSLSISFYGIGYQLTFMSSYSHVVHSQPFEVLYVNDYSPVFDPSNGLYNATISEDASIGLSVATVTATDQDSGSQGVVSYSIVAGNTGNKFDLNATSGVITTIGGLDRETTAVFTLTVRASDGAVAEKVRYTNGEVKVFISDINDNSPSFNTSPIVATVTENAAIDDVIITLQANDPDEGLNSEVRYSITSGNDVGLFAINSTSGEVKVNASYDMDQEPRPVSSHSLIIFAKDLGVPESHNTSVTLNISITAVNEFTPQLQHNSSFAFSFPENAPVGDGVLVTHVNATDQDYGDQGRVSFVITSGNDEGKFTINASTGELKLMSSLDYENVSSYTLLIYARDNDNTGNVKSALFTVNVTVLDMNDNAPTFSKAVYELDVYEDAAVGSVVFTFLAPDPDGGDNGLVSYSAIDSNHSEFWSLNSSTGELTINASLDMDLRELTTWTHTLVVMAKDAGTPMLHSNTTLVIHVTLKNEFAPSFASSDKSIEISEDIGVGSVIYPAVATDSDFGSDGEITYSITSGNDDLRFLIDSTSANITTDAVLDRESQSTYNLEITAKDRTTGVKRSGTMTLHISLSDVNDNAPSFEKNFFSQPVDENVAIGGDILTVTATDLDINANGELVYSIASGNDRAFFSIESSQGVIRAAKSLDIETQNHTADHTYQLVIFVKDKGSPQALNNSVPVTITVQSVNEFAPVLQHADNQVVELSENASVSTVIFDVNATDQDYGDDGVVTYSITNGNSLGTFSIDNSTGVITLAKELDYETISQHNLEITVTDTSAVSNNRRTITATLVVRVIDIPDSEMYTARVQMMQIVIASPVNPAGLAGISNKAALKIFLVYKNGSEVDITMEINRYTLDDASKSNNLFSTVINGGAPYVVANSQGLNGLGQLLVHVTNVNSIELNVTVIGSNGILTVQAVPYPEITNALKVTELMQVIPGHYQRVLLKVHLGLKNGDNVDVSNSDNTSFVFTNAQQMGGTFEFGPVPPNLFSVEGSGLSGQVWLQATFAGSLSGSVNLTLSSSVLKVVAINRFGLENVNTTFSGVAMETTTSPFAEVKMEDGSIHRIDNFTHYSGLLEFTSSSPATAKIHPSSGVVTLMADSSSRVDITATLVGNTSITATFAFYCNLEPSVGGIDIGDREGAAIPSLALDETWKMPVRMNPGSVGILAVHVEIQFSTTDLRLDTVTTDLLYTVVGSTVNIFGPVAESKALSEDIAEIVFTSKKSGIPQVNVGFYRTVNKELSPVPPKNVTATPCSNKILGDINLDCTFDIVDAAFISGYTIAPSNPRFTAEMKALMDVNLNGAIENNDAIFLSLIYLEKAKFVTELIYQVPDHDRESSDRCGLEFAVKLANKDGSPVTSPQAEVYFLFSHPGANVGAQFDQTTFSAGTKLSVQGASSVDGLIKASTGNDKFVIASTKSELESSDVGVSIIQEVPFDGTKHVVSMSLTSNPVSNADVTTWVKNQVSFTPQRKVQLSESTATCNDKNNDPLITETIVITFEGDYDEVVKGKEQQFEIILQITLAKLYPEATITNCQFSKGSIVASFNITMAKSKQEATVDKLWNDVKGGLKIDFNGTTLTTLPVMKVGSDVRQVEDAPEDEDRMPVYIIVIACIGAFLFILIIVIVTYCRYRRNKTAKINPSPTETPVPYMDDDKDTGHLSAENKYIKTSASTSWSVHSSPGGGRKDSFKYATPLASADMAVEPAFEEKEEQLLDSQNPKRAADLPIPVLAFPVTPSKQQATPTASPRVSRSQTPVTSTSGSPQPSDPGDNSPTRLQSPAELSVEGTDVFEDEFDADDELERGLRAEAVLRRRASSIDHEYNMPEMPGALMFADSLTTRRKMQVKVIRPNPELGILAHLAGVVKVNPSGTLEELRQDINSSMPGYLGSVRYLFLSRKFKIIDPRTENRLIVSGSYKKTIYVKVFHGAENSEYFCLCGKVAYLWCPRCKFQGYCGEECRDQDEDEHAKFCSKNKAKAMQSVRTRRVSRDSKY